MLILCSFILKNYYDTRYNTRKKSGLEKTLWGFFGRLNGSEALPMSHRAYFSGRHAVVLGDKFQHGGAVVLQQHFFPVPFYAVDAHAQAFGNQFVR
jgi:hypothetical protein